MLEVKQFRYGADNLGYLLFDDRSALAIDGGEANAILSFLKERNLRLLWVANTHGHPDHTCGNGLLTSQTDAKQVFYPDLLSAGPFRLGGREIEVIPTPGHSADSVCFYGAGYLFTGDTLFNGTVGNCFSGDMKGFYESLRRLMKLPRETIIYAGHDYVRMAMEFLRWFDPKETGVGRYLDHYDPEHVFSLLQDELALNPYLRFDDARVRALLQNRGLATGDSWQSWLSLMSLE